MPDIFLSYSREDQPIARRFAEGFEREGFSVWWDTTLRSGDAYDKVTEKSLREAKAVVVLWSRHSVESRWVRSEATVAERQGTLVPAMIERCERPVMFELTHTADLMRWKGEPRDSAWQSFVSDVRRYVQAQPGQQRDLSTPEPITTGKGARHGGGGMLVNRRTAIGGATALGLVGGGFAAWKAGLFSSSQPLQSSVAVLPFSNLSGDPSQNYLSEGLAAEIRAELARNNLLQVVAQASSNIFREHKQDARQISRKLGVSFLLDGNVRRSGDTLRIVTELISGSTGFSRWSETFERPLSDVFAVQSAIARAVQAALLAQVAPAASQADTGRKSARVGSTQSVAAYEAFLQGLDLYAQASGEDSDRAALAAFDRAISADASYGAAYAGRSRTLTVIANQYAQGGARRAAYDQAIDAATRAIELAPELADAHSALGFALFSGRLKVQAAREPYDRSHELGFGDADVLNRFALYCARVSRFDEARTAIKRAIELDPLNPRVYRSHGAIEYAARRYPESIAPVQQALALNPKMSGAWAAIGSSQLMLGQFELARSSFEKERSSLFGLTGIAIVARLQRKPAEADAALERLIRENGDNSLYQQAEVFAQWGERLRAVATLRLAREASDAGLILILNDPLLDPIRKDPGFTALLAELGFA